ncbi:transcriptional repressor ILP1-like [Rutidosis leptorrhynchoides]|uniref:transcriptional repressor ILP1-like n=1 Tax=Rutidosis leptorrhynchoides TaxID=125765 RepID=UPI003A991F93
MSNRGRNFRRRGDDDHDNDDADDKQQQATPSRSMSKPKIPPKSAAKPKTPILLSFADDDDQEESMAPPPQSKTKSKKSHKSPFSSSSASTSHKMTSSKDRTGQAHVPSNVQPQAGTYTKEALLELQKNTRTLARPSNTTTTATTVAEPKIVLKGLIKPPTQSKGGDEEDEREDMQNGDNEAVKLTSSMNGVGIEAKDSDPSSSFYPDKATIDAIKLKRERMRQSRAAPDYMPLDTGGVVGAATAADGLSDEEPEFRERISMLGAATGKKKGVFEDEEAELDNGYGLWKKKIASAASVVVESSNIDGDDEDDEERMWEEEQLRKGGIRMDDASRSSSSRVANGATASTAGNVHMQYQQKLSAGVYGPFPAANIGGSIGDSVSGLDGMSIAQQAEIAKKAMQDNFRRLKESHGRAINSLGRADENLSASLLKIAALENSLSAAGEKFIFMQKLRHFVSDLCDFLQDKAPFIEELEERMQESNQQRALAIIKRRAADSEDETMELEAAISAAKFVFNERGSSTAMIAMATSAAESAAAAIREQTNLPVKLDEFGRDVNLKKRLDMKRRAEARQRRKARAESKRLSSMEIDGAYQKVEGESSTDESEAETEAYESNRHSLIQVAENIFSDAADEFSQLSVVKERLENWKRDYSSSYRDAYMSLSLPTIIAPYAKLELLKWDPLHENAGFSAMEWHSLLLYYGLPKDTSDFSSDDADANLVPILVEAVALPILRHELQYCWDMLSTRETNNAVAATLLVIEYFDVSSGKLAELLTVVRDRLADAVANIKVPTWSPLELKAVPNAARFAAYQFGMSVRLMRNICLWSKILNRTVLEKLALDELLCRKVLPHVQSIASDVHDSVRRTERIVSALSDVWTGPNITGNRSPKLQPLVDYLMSLGRTLEKKRGGMDEQEASGLARRLKKLLVELNEYDLARDLGKTFHLKEAL